MTILIIILGCIGGVIALIMIVALFSKKSYTISREIVIVAPRHEVFNYVRFLKNQDYYSKWVMTDPSMLKTFRGGDGTKGFVYAWDSKDKRAGKGEQEIVGIHEGTRVESQIRFERPFKGISDVLMTTSMIDNRKTRVNWTFASSMKYPMNAAMLFVNFDKILGTDMETSLHRLKVILEKPTVISAEKTV